MTTHTLNAVDPVEAAVDDALAAETALSNLELLLRRGDNSSSAVTRAAAKKAREAVEQLRQRVRDEEVEKQVRDEIAELEAKLATAQEKLRRVNPSAAGRRRQPDLPGNVTAKQIRVWAAANNVDCPSHGRIPKAVIAAYRSAHDQAGERR